MDTRLEKLLNENFEEFLKEISQEDLLTREEELALLKAVQEKGIDSDEAERLVKANLRFVVSLVGQYRNRGLTLAELITIGAEELRKSILSYDTNGDTKFITHFVSSMRGRFEKETSKPIVYFDMDNVLVDFQSGLDQVSEEEKAKYADDGTGKPHYDDIPGLFSLMKPMPGAIDAVNALTEKYDCYILSTAPWNNPTALQDKLDWIKRHFGKVFHKRVIFTHHKNLCHQPGSYLIDDRTSHGADQFGDHHIQFGTEKFPDRKAVVEYLLNIAM